MPNYPTELVENVLPITETIDQTKLNQKGMFVVQGLDYLLAEQLVKVSNQPDIVENCLGDSTNRFASVENIVTWQARGRLALPLVKQVGDSTMRLVGFGWMGPERPKKDEPTITSAKITFAIRLYEGAIRQHNSLPYTRTILDVNEAQFGNEGVWLAAWGDNTRALGVYRQVGFQQVAEIPSLRNDKEVTRVFMTLGRLAS